MAQKRMFSLKIIDTDLFLDMPASSQLLYFQLSMRADDDGFVSSPQKIIKIVNCSNDDLKILIAKSFIIPFESGVCVIKHWKIHNYIQKDRYQETLYGREKSSLEENNGTYKLMDTECIQNVPDVDTQVRLDKVRLDKVRGDKVKKTFSSDSDEYRLANFLWSYIKNNNKEAKEPKLEIWSKGFDLIIRVDKRKVEDIKKVIIFSQQNEFWYKNILSPDKLRKHYEKLILQMKEPKYAKNKKESAWDLKGSSYAADNDINALEKQLLGWNNENE
ncbi:MAG: hypothetical protein ACI8WT_001729 [Clostridium sp.]|jgi:hypothetical protein